MSLFWVMRPLSPVKMEDLRVVAQRLLDERGFVNAASLYKRAGGRIPGSFFDYQRALSHLGKTRALDVSKRRHYGPKG